MSYLELFQATTLSVLSQAWERRPLADARVATVVIGYLHPVRSQAPITPFFRAARNNDVPCMRHFLEQDVDPDTTNREQETALEVSARHPDFALSQLLISYGARPSTWIILKAIYANNERLFRWALSEYPLLEDHDGGAQVLYAAVSYAAVPMTREILLAGVNPNNSTNPLHKAVSFNNAALIKVLLEGNANPHFLQASRRSALHLACADAKYNAAQLLIAGGGNVHFLTPRRETCLHLAVLSREDNRPIIHLLIDQKVDVNAADVEGNTPLHFALRVRKRMRTTTRCLVEAKADVHQANHRGDSPLTLALIKNLSVFNL